MKKKRRQFGLGFTLVELMVALMVASVILGAVATLAGATGCAKDATDQMGRQQAQLRCVTMRLTDLIRTANRVTSSSATAFTLWHDNNLNNVEDADELTEIRLDTDVSPEDDDDDTLMIGSSESHWKCNNVTFEYDAAAPATRFIAIWFDMDDNGVSQTHAVSAKLRASDDFY